MVPVQLKELVGYKAYDKADKQLEKKGFRRTGNVGGGQIADGHAYGPGQAAPVASQQQGRQHAEYIAKVEGRFFRAYGNINLQKGEADIAESRQQTGHGQPF